ncbi:MAG: hypothetical protein AB7G35_17310 [Hyphomicrobiaceae bacterium]
MNPLVVLSRVLLVVSLVVPADWTLAQQGRSRDDGAAARRDALTATPNRTTPVPQTNLFSTTPGLEQQPAAPGETAGRSQSGKGDRKSH